MPIEITQKLDLVLWSLCDIVTDDLPKSVVPDYNNPTHSVRIGMGAKYHAELFPWLTKCGRIIHDSATNHQQLVNCIACQNIHDPIFTYKAGTAWVVVWRWTLNYSMRIYLAENDVTHYDGQKILASDIQALKISLTTLTSQECIENDIRRMDAEALVQASIDEGQKSNYFPLHGIAYALIVEEKRKDTAS